MSSAFSPSTRALRVPPFHVMAMSREATRREAAGHRVLHLEVGQPSTGAPALAVDAVTRALARPLGYTNADGLLARALQHEHDHLDGVLFLDRVSALKRRLLLSRWRKLQEES